MLKREKKNLDHFCIEVCFELLATTKLQWRGWNIPKQSYGTQAPSLARSIRKLKSIGKWILGLPRNETCLAKKNVLSRHSSGVAYHPYACNNCISELDRTVVDWDLGLCGVGLGALRSWTWDLGLWTSELVLGTWCIGIWNLRLVTWNLGYRRALVR